MCLHISIFEDTSISNKLYIRNNKTKSFQNNSRPANHTPHNLIVCINWMVLSQHRVQILEDHQQLFCTSVRRREFRKKEHI